MLGVKGLKSDTQSADTVSAVSEPFMPGLFEVPSDGVDPALLASRCTKCGGYAFPARAICGSCGPNGQMESVKISGVGWIYSSTVAHVPSPTGLKPPYAYGYVDLVEVPLRVFALFTGADPDRFRPGMRVEMVLEALTAGRDGQERIAHKFRPAETEESDQ